MLAGDEKEDRHEYPTFACRRHTGKLRLRHRARHAAAGRGGADQRQKENQEAHKPEPEEQQHPHGKKKNPWGEPNAGWDDRCIFYFDTYDGWIPPMCRPYGRRF